MKILMIEQANEAEAVKCFVCEKEIPRGPWHSPLTKRADIENGIFFYSSRSDKAERKEIHRKCYKKMIEKNIDLKYSCQYDLVLIETPGITGRRLMKLWK